MFFKIADFNFIYFQKAYEPSDAIEAAKQFEIKGIFYNVLNLLQIKSLH